MSDARHYAEQARLYSELAAQADNDLERQGYIRVAAGFVQIAKDAATFEARTGETLSAPTAVPTLEIRDGQI